MRHMRKKIAVNVSTFYDVRACGEVHLKQQGFVVVVTQECSNYFCLCVSV